MGVNTTIKVINSIKIRILEKGVLVYSGLYILIEDEKQVNMIFTILKDEKFINYISLLGKYKAGGYYTFSSSDLKKVYWLLYLILSIIFMTRFC